MNKHIFFTVISLLLLVKTSFANPDSFYGLGKLSSNLITNITQDSSGFIWIATENGLNKFDGWNFTHYFRNDRDPNSLIGNYIESFLNDKDGTLWIGSNRGLQYYCAYEDKFHSIQFPNNIYPSVQGIIQLQSGEIWIATAGYGIFSVDKKKMKATELVNINKQLNNPYANYMLLDSKFRIWIALSDNRIACISQDIKTINIQKVPIDARHNINSITEDHQGNIFLGTSSNVFMWNNTQQKYINIENKEATNSIRGVTCLKDGSIYVNTTGQGMKLLDINTLSLNTPSKLIGGYINPIKEKITSFYEDNKGNLWLGCYKKGLLMVSNESKQFDFWDFSIMEKDADILSMYSDEDNSLWIGTSNGTLLNLNDKGLIRASFNIKKDISSMFEDHNGTFWLGSYEGGLISFNKKDGKCTSYRKFEGKSIVAFGEDLKNNMYISIMGEGFVRYNYQTKEWKHITDTTKLNSSRKLFNKWIGNILCDSDGLIWLAQSTGVDCYDPEKNIILDFAGNIDLRSCIAITLLEDKKHNIWMGTNNGLFCYNKNEKKLTHFGIDDGLPNNIICGLGIDKQGNIWGSTLNGIFQLNSRNKHIACYYTGNGLVDREYSQNISIQDKHGYIYFAGLYGITRFLPDNISDARLDYKPILTHLYLNNETVSANKKINRKPISKTEFKETSNISLSYNERSISFEFSTMNFHNPENIVFEYRLLGMNEKWTSTFPGENRITYNFLSPGTYILEVRAFENNTYSTTNSLTIYISPPWYSTAWARCLYLILLFGLLSCIFYLWNKRRLRKLEELNNEEKLKFFINIAHEIRSPMTLIINPLSELLRQKNDENTSRLLNTIQLNTNRIMNLINQLLDIRKIDKGQMKIACEETDLIDFIKDLLNIFDYQTAERSIKLSFESNITHLPVWIDRNNFDKVLVNLLVNAFKHTQDGGAINLSVQTPQQKSLPNSTEYVEIKITDSGTGINEKEIERIFERFYQSSSQGHLGFGIGLNLTKMLVELHHGTIQAFNREDSQGSCFIVRIPLGREHLNDNEIAMQSQTRRLSISPPMSCEEKENTTNTIKNKKRQRVLIVDDDEEIREYLQKELSHTYKVITAENGSEALRILLQQRIDLVISDIMMPETDGFTLLKKIRNNDNISHIPVVLLTSQIEFQNRMKGWNSGADGFMDKPFQIEELLLLCNNLISNRSLLKGKFIGIKELETRVTPLELKSNDEIFIKRLMGIINKNMDNSKFSIEILAQEVGISRTQLHRKLKEITGISTSDFIRNIRLKQAARLLIERKVNISQVAYATGFSNPTIFAVAFKKFYGCTPTEYMANNDSE